MAKQSVHEHNNQFQNKYPITLVCDGVTSPANIGSLFRICDAFGVSKIIFCNTIVDTKSSRMRKTARSTIKNALYTTSDNCYEELLKLSKQNYTIYNLEITTDSIPLKEIIKKNSKKIALVIGNEKNGISENCLELVKQHIHISMHGQNSSMNVATATAIALYELTNIYFES